MALYFGRDMLKVFKDTVFYDSLESLFQKAMVLEPESLREEIRAEAELMANRYEGKTVAEESPPYDRTHDHPLQRG